jgi:hypothetical protein
MDIDKYDDKGVQLIGWGKSSRASNVSKKLKRVSIQVIPQR